MSYLYRKAEFSLKPVESLGAGPHQALDSDLHFAFTIPCSECLTLGSFAQAFAELESALHPFGSGLHAASIAEMAETSRRRLVQGYERRGRLGVIAQVSFQSVLGRKPPKEW